MFSKAKNKNEVGGAQQADMASDDQLKRSASAQGKNGRSRSANRGDGVPSIISGDMVITGSIVSEGEVQFDGELNGDIKVKGLVIGENAKVSGEVMAEKVRVCGTVEGAIKAVNVELASTALVEGDILHTSLSIENGARFDGNCRHSDDPLSGTPKKSKPRPIPAPPSKPVPTSTTAAAQDVQDAEIAYPDETPQPNADQRELMPMRDEPVADRTFVKRPSGNSDLR